MTTEQQRAAFERHFGQYSMDFSLRPNGDFAALETSLLWEGWYGGWKAALAASPVEREPLTDEYIDQHIGPDEGDREAVADIVREVERAHGIVAAQQKGGCENRRQPGGCHLHNLQCGYPECDKGAPVEALAQPNRGELIDFLVTRRQQLGGSISEHNHRKLLGERTTAELRAQYQRIMDNESAAAVEAKPEAPKCTCGPACEDIGPGCRYVPAEAPEQPALPPLPHSEPVYGNVLQGSRCVVRGLFTVDQMRTYGAACVAADRAGRERPSRIPDGWRFTHVNAGVMEIRGPGEINVFLTHMDDGDSAVLYALCSALIGTDEAAAGAAR